MFSTFYKHVLKGMEWIRKLLENPTCNNRILIHCTSGMNRSVAFTEAYLLLNPNRMVGVPTRGVTAEMRAERAGIDFPDDSKAARLRLQAMDAVVKTRHGARADTAYDVCLNSIAENVALYGSKNAVSILRKRPASSGAYVCIAYGSKSKLSCGEQPMHPRRKTTGFTLGSGGRRCDKCSNGPWFDDDGIRGWLCTSVNTRRHFICEYCMPIMNYRD